jgi:hypothetical protein
MSYYIHSADQRLPDKARLGAGTLARLAEIQLEERLSVDVIVARAVEHYFKTAFKQNNNGGIHGRNKETTEGVGQH